MDSDEYDDDLADEDLAQAFEQSTSGPSSAPGSSSTPNANFHFPTRLVSGDSNVSQNQNQVEGNNLTDLPDGAFSSSPEQQPSASTRQVAVSTKAARRPPQQRFARTGSNSFRQTNLFGETIDDHGESHASASQPGFGRIYRGNNPEGPSCHHELDTVALKTWVYPNNLGAVRDYQYSIVKNGLFNNTLVALPTGLGKTFIAATVMLNYYRWTKRAKIVFVAPTKPLVAQQVDACFNIVGIPRSDTTMLTGETAPALRVDEWGSKRVFFMTPQTLLNDISRGYADPKSIVLLVVDEAHRATGEYAYAKVVKQMRRFNPFFRVLALTATPGSKVETVQEVIDNLGISHTEIRTEDSIDIRQYVQQRNIDQRVLDPSDEMCEIKDLFTKALKPLMDKLTQQNIYFGRDPMSITTYGLMQQEKEWFGVSGRHKPQALQNMMRAIFSILKSLAHSIKLLNFHGIKPFYENVKDFRSSVEEKGERASKYKQQVTSNPNFKEMMDKVDRWLRIPDFVGHPKLTELANTMLNHFIDAQGVTSTRAIVFSEYRDSAEEIVRALNIHKPLISATVFVGQAESKRSAGMKQAEQIETVEKFKDGHYNVLVATSIGEEGLDIGQVDLIVCYDASSSPIRMLQRMGRTGRKREGNVVLLLMRGKEEDNFTRAKENYQSMQALICEGSRFNFRHDLSARIVPRDTRPEVDMRHIDIPIENTQNTSLPEPRRRKSKTKPKKMPAKKFHMPDGVETGFVKASRLGQPETGGQRGRPKKTKPPEPDELDELVDIPPFESVLLTPLQMSELDRNYRSLPYSNKNVEETQVVDVNAYPRLNRRLRPVGRVKHGVRTKKFVKLMQAWATKYKQPSERWAYPYGEEDTSNWQKIPPPPLAPDTDEERSSAKKRSSDAAVLRDGGLEGEPRSKKRRSKVTLEDHRPINLESDAEEAPNDEDDQAAPSGRKRVKHSRPGKKRKPLGKTPQSRRRQRKGGINSDELGDDCERTSDVMETDGSDSGADLLDFIVEDDHPISQFTSTLPTCPVASPFSVKARGRVTEPASRAKSSLVPLELPPTQESLDEFPDLDKAVQSRKPAAAPPRRVTGRYFPFLDSDDSDVAPQKDVRRQNRRRGVVEES
ncbi:helicase C-terminal domain-containing protein [Sodiomyces alkalinus F11]|uniref:ATP-dependent DNA helicase n=1 Tax=Sodiomyces alkalinus (strain CBS 110278 / VKM F-3762 / F11) TaxID=1314773 RepID=A0A3N2PZV4_SODAK|nr:helicase C-terminal domain-containing protein [Sodiomyces alkalinus F11]ROT40061.1 helicase C-terminal domain-containing protein [Sodiomyces alkalinus F11]